MIGAYDEGWNVVELVEWENQTRSNALNDFIEEVKIEIGEIYDWDDDDYFIGMKAGYHYSIEIAERLKAQNDEINICDRCTHKDSCVCVPYGCECFKIDLLEDLQKFAQWLWDNNYLTDEAFTIRLVAQYKLEQLKQKGVQI